MHAHARLAVATEPGRPHHTRISCLRSATPLVLRPTITTHPDPVPHWNFGGAARVSIAAGAAGPIGGDDIRLDVEVGAGATLVLRAVAATLVLPGPHGDGSVSQTHIRVASGGTLIWLPGVTIAARACDHRALTRIDLAPGARLLTREELLLGRHGERPGRLRQRLRVTHDRTALHDQDIVVGPDAAGWDGAAVIGGRRALGALLIVDPGWDTGAILDKCGGMPADAALLPLSRQAMLSTALGPDTEALRHTLEECLAELHAAMSATAAVAG